MGSGLLSRMTPMKNFPVLAKVHLKPLICLLVLGMTPALAQQPVQIAIPAGGADMFEEDMKVLKAYQPVMDFVPTIFTLQEEIRKGQIRLNASQKKTLIQILDTLRSTENLTVEKTATLKKQLESKVLTAKQLMQLDTAILKKQAPLKASAGDAMMMAQMPLVSDGERPENPAEKLKRGDPFSPFQNPESLKQLKAFIQDLQRN